MSLLLRLRNSSPRSPISHSRLCLSFVKSHNFPHTHTTTPAATTTRLFSTQQQTPPPPKMTDNKPHPLEFLIGTWAGRGKGFYPTIPSFEFFEELTFTKDPAGRPVVAYSQKTRRAVPGSGGDGGETVPVPGPPLHAEAGFIRLPGWSNERCELVLSQPTGVASIEVGAIKGTTIDWETTSIIRSPSAKAPHTTHFTRKWVINPEEKTFSYEFSMATENTPLTRHLEVHLLKV
ncbi:THAP domain-containing protein 4 [Linnemannia schmuckeri]|uniref:THAP domain-containing protein 4 n=1 Tax=Linnemannia schmuckeri TaxID=64567 RepID=A0A9P5S406_9FUNG|nr:THAP domain-containing protein 4 [Linnemannia schmuckeri]